MPGSAKVDVYRGEIVESWHEATIAVVHADGSVVASAGDPDVVTFLRSAAKPVQAAAILACGAGDAYGWTDEHVAVVAGSHNGERVHTDLVQEILGAASLDESRLQCGRHAPYGQKAALEVGSRYSALHHNCSGKHAGMLAACAANGWPVESYRDPDHPLQQRILEAIALTCAVDRSNVGIATDGCGVPTYAVPIRAAAQMAARVSAAKADTSNSVDAALARVREAMLRNPELVAGAGRIDTRLMTAFASRVWVKAGAEACYVAGLVGGDVGIAVKVHDGSSRAVEPLLAAAFESQNVRPAPGAPTYAERVIRNAEGTAVGRLDARVTWAQLSDRLRPVVD